MAFADCGIRRSASSLGYFQLRISSNTTINGHNLATIRIQNRSTVLGLLHREDSGLSRRELARRTGLDASTITHIIDEFIANEIVRECGIMEPNGAPRRGRRETILELVPTAAWAIGVHLGVRAIRLAACDLRGRVVARRAAILAAGTPPTAAMDLIADLIDGIRREPGLDPDRILGVGIGAVAFLNPASGSIQSAPSLGWGEVAITGPLAERLGLPVLLEHHVRAMTLAEQWFGRARSARNFALINIDSSIGVGTVVDGKLIRGDSHRAGQIAHLIVREDGPLCSCGRRGCLVMLASYRAIANQIRETVRQNPQSTLAHVVAENPDIPAEHIAFPLARQGDGLALKVIEEAAAYIAPAIAYLASLLDPGLIVLSAANTEHAEALLGPIRQHVLAQAPLNPTRTLRLVTSALGSDIGVLGAASLVLDSFLAAPILHPAHSRRGAIGLRESVLKGD